MSSIRTHRILRALACSAALAQAGLPAVAQTSPPLASSSVSLGELFWAAKDFDAAYLSARAQAEATQHQAAQAQALHRPTVGVRGTIDRTHSESAVRGPFSTSGYGTRQVLAISAKQPLFNRANDADVDKSEQALIAAQADLQIAEADLVVRLTQAYFDVLAAQDILTTSLANRSALNEQLAAAKRNFEVGNTTITDTREAQARSDLAGAQEIAARNDLKVKSLALDQLVGRSHVQPRPLLTPVNLPALGWSSADEWAARAEDAPLVRKARAGLAVARLEIRKARAGHYPTLDATASMARTEIESANQEARLLGGAGTNSSVGLELNVPLFAGFAIQNRIKEALSLGDKAEHDLDNARRSVALGTRQAFFGVESGMAQVKAFEAAEVSAKLALEATQLGYRVGVRINKDVLDAQNLLANTQKDLYKARYEVLVAGMKLRQASGTLQPEDLDAFKPLLAP